jgi:hypothetical protein
MGGVDEHLICHILDSPERARTMCGRPPAASSAGWHAGFALVMCLISGYCVTERREDSPRVSPLCAARAPALAASAARESSSGFAQQLRITLSLGGSWRPG